jgi:hypothetical protein
LPAITGARLPSLQQHAHRDQVHVGDAVLETGRDEGRNRKHDCDDAVDDAAPGQRQPHRQAHQNIAEHTVEKGAPQRKAAFGRRDLQVLLGHQASVQVGMPRQEHQHREPGGAGEIGQADHRPVAQKFRRRDLAVRPGHCQQVVAGEELGAGDDDQDQPQGKDDSAGHASRREPQRRIGYDQHVIKGSQSDERAGQHAEHDHGGQW